MNTDSWKAWTGFGIPMLILTEVVLFIAIAAPIYGIWSAIEYVS